MIRIFFEKRVSVGLAILFNACHAISIDITTVLPVPVAILKHCLCQPSGSDGKSMPCLSLGLASASQIAVSIASCWQKKSGYSRCSLSRQYSSNLRVVLVILG